MKRVIAWARRNVFKIAVGGVVVLLLAVTAILQVSMDSSAKERPGWDQSSPFDTGRSVMDVLGGVRQSLAAYFWTRTDTIFHAYSEHKLGADAPLYPYYWMITRLDQHFEMPFYYASWMLCEFGKVDEGLRLAIEGVKANPESAQLQENLAQIYFFFKKDPEKAKYHGEKALALAPSEEDLYIFQTFQKVVNDVLSGKKKIPNTIPLDQINRTHVEPEDAAHSSDHSHEHSD